MYHSTETAVLKELFDSLSAADTGILSMLTLYFWTCPLQTSYDLGGIFHASFKSFRINHTQYVRYDESTSTLPLCCSAATASALEPILFFLLYTVNLVRLDCNHICTLMTQAYGTCRPCASGQP